MVVPTYYGLASESKLTIVSRAARRILNLSARLAADQTRTLDTPTKPVIRAAVVPVVLTLLLMYTAMSCIAVNSG
jgi:hypothetical protein